MNYPKGILDYADLIEKFNKRINLISRKDMPNLMTRHIDDGVLSHSAYLSSFRLPDEYPIYDLGSGNGIPGMIWAILSPDSPFVLVDTDERKCEFLKYVANKLSLNNVEVIVSKFEDLNIQDNSVFLCRGLTSISEFLTDQNPFLDKKGFFVKGSTWNTEIGDVPLEKFKHCDYSLADHTVRSLVFYQK